MYALINGQELLLGPIAFNYRMINNELEELEVDYRVTSQSYQSVPISITENIKILPARYDDPDYDPRFEYLSNITYQILETEVVFSHIKGEKSLQQIKDEYKLLVKPERQKKENQIITITVNNIEVEVSTDREERDRFVTKLVSCSNVPNATHNYKFRNDVWVVIGCAEIQYILEQIDDVVQTAFDWELAKIEEIDTCTTGEEVYAVQIISLPTADLISPPPIV